MNLNGTDWEQHKLGNESDVRDGTHNSPKYINKGYPLITSKNLSIDGLDFENVSYVSKADFDAINARSKVDVGDILFGMIGTIGNPVLLNNDGFAIKNVSLIKEKKNISNKFLIQLLKSEVFFRYIQLENEGGTQKFLSLRKIRDFEFSAPPIHEQSKISHLLETLDIEILLYQQQLKLYKKIKQSLLQTMFPRDEEKAPKVRFADFHDDWKQHSLKEVMKNFIVPMRDKPKKFDGNIPWTRIEDIDGKYLNRSKSGRYISNNTIKEMHLKIIPSNSIIVSASATFGVVAIVTQNLVTNQTFIGMVPNSNYTIDFLYSLFQSPAAQKKMKKESAGSTIFYIPRESFEKMKFNLPIISEQNKVGEILKKIDSLISKYEYQLILYKDIKKFYLQRLFI